MDAVKNVIKAYIIDNFLFGDGRGLEDSTSFLENGIIDSTGILELVAFLEEEFSVNISDDDLLPENLNSLDAVSVFITNKKA